LQKQVFRKDQETKGEARMVENESDYGYNHILLISTTNYELGNTDDWYLDTRCSNHMTSHKEWLIYFEETSKNQD
jgi:hypothetical protein